MRLVEKPRACKQGCDCGKKRHKTPQPYFFGVCAFFLRKRFLRNISFCRARNIFGFAGFIFVRLKNVKRRICFSRIVRLFSDTVIVHSATIFLSARSEPIRFRQHFCRSAVVLPRRSSVKSILLCSSIAETMPF